jgi:hypothetical protein
MASNLGAARLTVLGNEAERAHDVWAAAADYRAALASDWSYAPALFGLSRIELRSAPVEAAALLDIAVETSPASAEAHRLLGRALLAMGETATGDSELRKAAQLGQTIP